MLDNLNLMNGMTQKMDYLQTRQRVLSENVSNANTPGFQASDVKAPDFAKTLRETGKGASTAPLAMTMTSPNDIGAAVQGPLKGQKSRQTYEVTPEKNSVTIEEQMIKSSQNGLDYQLMTNLYNKNLGLLRAAMKN